MIPQKDETTYPRVTCVIQSCRGERTENWLRNTEVPWTANQDINPRSFIVSWSSNLTRWKSYSFIGCFFVNPHQTIIRALLNEMKEDMLMKDVWNGFNLIDIVFVSLSLIFRIESIGPWTTIKIGVQQSQITDRKFTECNALVCALHSQDGSSDDSIIVLLDETFTGDLRQKCLHKACYAWMTMSAYHCLQSTHEVQNLSRGANCQSNHFTHVPRFHRCTSRRT